MKSLRRAKLLFIPEERTMRLVFGKVKKWAMQLTASPKSYFQSEDYLRHNSKRLEHLASLHLDIAGKTVLELGAGIGDHTSFFLDRGCRVVSTDARDENLKILASRYPELETKHLDLNKPDSSFIEKFDIVYSYGLLYHLHEPASALACMSNHCVGILLLETVVSFGSDDTIHLQAEDASDPTQAVAGRGCRPTRTWVFNTLKKHFRYVYIPTTQPNHEEFPTDWETPVLESGLLTRSIFIASREELTNPLLVQNIAMKQSKK